MLFMTEFGLDLSDDVIDKSITQGPRISIRRSHGGLKRYAPPGISAAASDASIALFLVTASACITSQDQLMLLANVEHLCAKGQFSPAAVRFILERVLSPLWMYLSQGSGDRIHELHPRRINSMFPDLVAHRGYGFFEEWTYRPLLNAYVALTKTLKGNSDESETAKSEGDVQHREKNKESNDDKVDKSDGANYDEEPWLAHIIPIIDANLKKKELKKKLKEEQNPDAF